MAISTSLNDVDFWSVTDLLGLILSSIGRAPLGATKRNFYLLLTAVYGKWCSNVCSTPPAFVVQCSWRETPGEPSKFFLGASLAGHRASKAATGSWRHVLDRARYYIPCSEPLKLAGWSPKRSPSLQAHGPTFGKPFGRCAETYPLRVMLWSVNLPANDREATDRIQRAASAHTSLRTRALQMVFESNPI